MGIRAALIAVRAVEQGQPLRNICHPSLRGTDPLCKSLIRGGYTIEGDHVSFSSFGESRYRRIKRLGIGAGIHQSYYLPVVAGHLLSKSHDRFACRDKYMFLLLTALLSASGEQCDKEKNK